MKVACDEHVPVALVRLLQSFSNETQFRKLTGGLIVEKARDYAPTPEDSDYLKGNDVPWIRRYSQSGGRVIISGDTDMLSQPHERLALIEEGMVVILFGSKWSGWKFFKKCALVLCWWPEIVATVNKAEKGTFWRVPTSFEPTKMKLEQLSTEDRKLVRIKKQKAAQAEVAARRRVVREGTTIKQRDFGFPAQERPEDAG